MRFTFRKLFFGGEQGLFLSCLLLHTGWVEKQTNLNIGKRGEKTRDDYRTKRTTIASYGTGYSYQSCTDKELELLGNRIKKSGLFQTFGGNV